MAQLLNRVQPGDVITAEMWNLVVDAINELMQAGQTNGIQIAALLPAGTQNEPIRISTLLQISGQNFGYAIGQTSVTFRGPAGDVVVDRDSLLTGSSDSRLLLIVPPIPSLPNTGDNIPLVVNNGVASDMRTVFVQPITVTLQGDAFVNWRAGLPANPNPNPLQAGQAAEFNYQVQTGINIPAAFDLSVNIPSATTTIPANLVSSIEFRQDGALISGNRIEMGKTETRNILVRIPQIPNSFANQTFTLQVTASSGNVTGSDTRSFTVGQVVTPTDPNIVVQQTGAVVLNTTSGNIETDPAVGRLEASTIKLAAGRQMIVQFNVKLTQQGTYDLTVEPLPGTTLNGWDLALVNTATPIPVTTDNDQSLHLVQFGATVSAGAETGAMVFRIKRQGATNDWFTQFGLELLP